MKRFSRGIKAWLFGCLTACNPPPSTPQTKPVAASYAPRGADLQKNTVRTQPEHVAQENTLAAKRFLEQGLQAFDHGAYAQCETALNQALELDPFAAQAYFVLGKVYMLYGVAQNQANYLLQAQSMMQRALRIDSNLVQAQELLQLLGLTLQNPS